MHTGVNGRRAARRLPPGAGFGGAETFSETAELAVKVMFRQGGGRACPAEEPAWCAQRTESPLWLNV